MPAPGNPLFFKYELRCTHPGCPGKRLVDQAISANWQLGDVIDQNPQDDSVRCPLCKRTKMKVASLPPQKEPTPPVGWTKVPTE